MGAPRRWIPLCLGLLCLAGMAISAELTRIHLYVHTDPSYHSVCAVSEGLNCETVAASPYSVFAGLPVSVWGLLGYLVMGALSTGALLRRRPHPAWPLGLLTLTSAFAVGVAMVLATISATRIDSLCLFCMASYAVSGAIFALSLWGGRHAGASPPALLARDVKALAARPALVGLAVVLGVGAVALLQTAVPRYWDTLGWRDLPELATGTDRHGHHWIGASAPRLTIVEFSDYECPHCRAAHKDIRALAAQHPRAVRLVHRHLPLDMACHPLLKRPFHARACLFAEAAECAGLQGQFWGMNDALFSVQETTKTDNVDPAELAVRLGLDRPAFVECLKRHTTRDRVAADVKEAMRLRLRGTPSFLVNGRLYTGRIPAEELKRLLADDSPSLATSSSPRSGPAKTVKQ